MGSMRFGNWSSILIHLLILQRIYGSSGARELAKRDQDRPGELSLENTKLGNTGSGTDNVLRLPTERRHEGTVHHHHHHHHDQSDPSTRVFFFMEDLKEGNVVAVHFPKRDPSSSPKFLPREEADSIPFSLTALPAILEMFSFHQGSSQAKAMKNTLRECEAEPILGETKLCPTSLESLIDFARSVFDSKFTALSTSHLAGSSRGALLQNYTVSGPPKEVPAPRMVACHTMPYPYAVFYCHSQDSPSRVFEVPLLGENGDRVKAVAVCHLDTTQWGRDHMSFRVLGIEPGSSPVCHFFPADHFVWVPVYQRN